MDLSFYQLKQAALNLKQKPTFVLSVVASLGLALGVLLTVLTLVYAMLVKPLPYPNQDALYQIELQQFDSSGKHNVSGFNYPSLIDFYQQQGIFSNAALVDYGVSTMVSHDDEPLINASYITPEWFDLLGATMAKGRYFSKEEGLNSHAEVAVISFATWQQLFAGKEDILGTTISTRNKHFKVVGVLSERFVEPALKEVGYQSDVFLPWDANPSSKRQRETWWSRAHYRSIIGTLDNSINQHQAEEKSSSYINTKWREQVADADYFKGWHVETKLHSFADKIIGDTKRAVYLLLASVVFLVAVALMNITNLLLSRLAESHYTLSIHASLGAKPNAIFKLLFIDNTILTALSLFVAIAVSYFGCALLQQHLASILPRLDELDIGGFTLIAATVIGLLVALLFSFIGTRSLNYKSLNQGLITSGKGSTAQVSQITRKALMISQIAIATVLIFSASTIGLRAYQQVTYDDGMHADSLLSLQLLMYADNLPSFAERDVLLNQLKQSLEELPQVEKVSRASSPLTFSPNSWSLLELDSLKRVTPIGRNIDSNYFAMSGQRLLEGELFTETMVKDKVQQLIINQQLAEMLAPNGSALGKRLSFGTDANSDQFFVVTGVVSNLKIPGETSVLPWVYRPLNDAYNMTIRLKDGQSLNKQTLVSTLASVSPIFKIFKFEKVAALKQQRLFAFQLALVVTLAITFISVLLTFIGLYGILSYVGQMRRSEIATHLAIGAKGKDIIRLIISDNVMVIGFGICLGLLILLGIMIVFNTSVLQYLTAALIANLISTLAIVTVISLLACYIPIRKYITRPVMTSLRGDFV